MNRSLKLFLAIILGLLTFILLITLYLNNYRYKVIPSPMPTEKVSPSSEPLPLKKPIDKDGVVCAMDVKKCPDGSYVGRVAPLCSFAPCPGDNKY